MTALALISQPTHSPLLRNMTIDELLREAARGTDSELERVLAERLEEADENCVHLESSYNEARQEVIDRLEAASKRLQEQIEALHSMAESNDADDLGTVMYRVADALGDIKEDLDETGLEEL